MAEEEEEVFTYNPNGKKKSAVAVRSGKPAKKAANQNTNKAVFDMADPNDIDLEEIPTINDNENELYEQTP